MTIGENIRRFRKEKKLTQKQLGVYCGIAESAIRRYELGGANPKIETIEKIAAALDVPIRKIKEDITWDEYRNTSEVKQTERIADAMEGIIAFLADIYGKAECKELNGKYASGLYYLIGEGDNQFVLYDGDIDTLYESTRASIPAIVNRIKDARPEQEIIDDYMKDLNSYELNKEALERIKKMEAKKD